MNYYDDVEYTNGISYYSIDFPYFTEPSVKESINYSDYKLVIKLAVPGVKKEDLDITTAKNYLEVTYKGDSDFIPKFEQCYDTEGFKADKAKVSLVDGILEISMELKDSHKPKKLTF